MKKLNLNKETIAALDSKMMSEIKGGFTYSLSTGARCQASKARGASNPYDCGAALVKAYDEKQAEQVSPISAPYEFDTSGKVAN